MMATLIGLKTISPRELAELVKQRQVTVIDFNSSESWQKAHVSGALNLDPTNCGDADLPPDKESGLVFYCSHPMCRKAPRRLVARSTWAIATSKSCPQASADGWPRACPSSRTESKRMGRGRLRIWRIRNRKASLRCQHRARRRVCWSFTPGGD